jgi:hypothetical protein
LESIVEDNGDWNQYDIVGNTTGNKNDPVVLKSANDHLSEALSAIAKKGPTTKEELAYERYDLLNFPTFQTISYSKIFNNFGKTFKQWDDYAGTTFYSELQALVAIEKELKAKEKAEATSIGKPVATPVATSAPIQPAEVIQKEEAKRRPSVEKVDNDTIVTFVNSLPMITKFSEAEKNKFIQQIDKIENGKPIFKDTFEGQKISVFPCDSEGECNFPGTEIRTETPLWMPNCPVCGKEFK